MPSVNASVVPSRAMMAAGAQAQDVNWPDEYWQIDIPGGGSWKIWNNGCIYWGEGMAINGDIPWVQTLARINERPDDAGGPRRLPPKEWLENGRFLKIGPWDSSGLRVTRLIRIAGDRLSIRWTDIIANDSNEDCPMGVMYDSDTPLARNLVGRDDFKSDFTGREYGFVSMGKAEDKGRDDRPALCHVFGSRGRCRLPDMILFIKDPPGVMPSLEKHAADPDPEIRERVKLILRTLRGPGEAEKGVAQ